MPKPHGATLLSAVIFAVILIVAYHFTLGRKG